MVREGTEGPYTGNGGTIRKGTEHEVATEVSVNTAFGVERVVRDAFARAQARPRKKLTLVHKNNVLTFAGHLWTNVFNKVAAEFPEVTTDYIHVDAATIYLVTDPARFDVIVTDNLFGDIITDLAAAVSGGIGVAASGNINPSGEFPSMFEPVHGSAPDIAGQGKADPTATVLSVALLLRHLGYEPEAVRIEEAVSADLADRTGKPARSTTEIGDALAVRVSRLTPPPLEKLSQYFEAAGSHMHPAAFLTSPPGATIIPGSHSRRFRPRSSPRDNRTRSRGMRECSDVLTLATGSRGA